MATELAKAYVQILPSARGMKANLQSILNDNVPTDGKAGEKLGSGLLSGIKRQITSSSGGLSTAASVVAAAALKGTELTIKASVKTVEEITKRALDSTKLLAKTALDATTTAVEGIAALTKGAVESYADYEQLAGGVETLFGADASAVMASAKDAYKSAGLSANDYMEQVTSFSASLIKGLGGDTAEAASIADMAIIDMADNANKMGTDMVSIQNAYQGFAKRNYTMLDNLKLGYGGTAAEMARLINDSGVLGDTIEITAADLNKVSFDQMIKAIHKVQNEMGITGTTAEEAEETISGSLGQVRASWKNLMTSLIAGDMDVSDQVGKLSESVKAFGDNIFPAITTALGGIGELIVAIVPEIVSAIPVVAQQVAPQLVTALTGIFPALSSAVTTLVEALSTQMPTLVPLLVQGATTMFLSMVTALNSVTDQLLPMLPTLIDEIVNALITGLPLLIDGGFKLLKGIIKGIADNADKLVNAILKLIPDIVDTIIDNLPEIIEAGAKILGAIVKGLADHLPELLQKTVELLAAVIVEIGSHLGDFVSAGIDMIVAIGKGIVSIFSPISDALSDFFLNVASWFSEKWEKFKAFGSTIISFIGDGIKGAFQKIGNALGFIWDKIKGFFSGIWDKIEDIGGDIIDNIVTGITSAISAIGDALGEVWQSIKDFFAGLWDQFVEIGSNILEGIREGLLKPVKSWTDFWEDVGGDIIMSITEFFGIDSPSKLMRDEVGKYLALGIEEGFVDEMDGVNRRITDSINTDFDMTAGGSSMPARGVGVVMRLTDSAGRVIAEGTAASLDELQGTEIELEERGLAG